MFQTLRRMTLILVACGGAAWLTAAGNPIGMAVANGSFEVNHARVWGNTTLFDGSSIETAKASSQLQLNGGAVMRLAANTRATVYQHKMVLEHGLGQMDFAPGFAVEARSLRISPDTNNAIARINMDGSRSVQVAAIRGVVRVTNASGLLVAKVAEGSSLSFEPDTAGASAPTQASGCLLTKSGKFLLAEQTTGVVLELHENAPEGNALDKEIGNRIQITGMAVNQAPAVAQASQVIRVAGLKLIAKGGCTAIAKKLGASAAVAGGVAATAGAAGAGTAAAAAGTVAGATAAGIGAGTVAVIGGVAAAATVGGLAVTGTLPGQGEDTPPASR